MSTNDEPIRAMVVVPIDTPRGTLLAGTLIWRLAVGGGQAIIEHHNRELRVPVGSITTLPVETPWERLRALDSCVELPLSSFEQLYDNVDHLFALYRCRAHGALFLEDVRDGIAWSSWFIALPETKEALHPEALLALWQELHRTPIDLLKWRGRCFPAPANSANDEQKLLPPVDREFDGGYPYFPMDPWTLYVNRPTGHTPLTLDDWLAVVALDPELTLEESYRQLNIDRGVEENWREPGRTRWKSACGTQEDLFHFKPATFSYLEGSNYVGGNAAEKWQAMVRRLTLHPTLEEWEAAVAADPYLMPVQEGPRGLAVWVGRDGRVKHRFRYVPPSVWLYGYGAGATPCIESARLKKCQEIALALGAEVQKIGNPLIS